MSVGQSVMWLTLIHNASFDSGHGENFNEFVFNVSFIGAACVPLIRA